MPANSGEGLFNAHYLGDTQQTTEQHKFGKGSMLIGEKKGLTPIRGLASGFIAASSDSSEAIHKMTITVWIRPVTPPEGVPNSFKGEAHILARYVGNGMKAGSFIYNFTPKAFNFWYVSADEGNIQKFRSAPLPFIEPDEWSHMALTFDEGNVTFYFNGLPIAQADAVHQGAPSIGAPQGKSSILGFSSLLPGDCIDDFGVFEGRALTEPEIDRIYTKGLEEFIKPPSKK
ncbi:MAG: LamG domain-containing protein [Chthoniobacterales bacterium]